MKGSATEVIAMYIDHIILNNYSEARFFLKAVDNASSEYCPGLCYLSRKGIGENDSESYVSGRTAHYLRRHVSIDLKRKNVREGKSELGKGSSSTIYSHVSHVGPLTRQAYIAIPNGG